MKHIFHHSTILLLTLLCLGKSLGAMDLSERRLLPDSLVLYDGTILHGLIVKNDANEIVLQERMGEQEIPKSKIRRIDDQGECHVYFADMIHPDKLPPWRMIVQDLRTDDNIKSFRQIPPTAIDTGYLRNIPYLSFRINKNVEMNVYGNPEDPVCLEFGVYEKGEKITRFKKLIREYLSGVLESRSDIAALYSLNENGDERQAKKLRFKILPPSAPDAYGGWWLSVYDPKRLDKCRVSDAAYRKVTLPFAEVNGRNGTLRGDRNMKHLNFLNKTMMNWSQSMPDLRGFYRDKSGELKLLTSGSERAAQ